MNFPLLCNYYPAIFEYSHVILTMELTNVEAYRRNNEDLAFANTFLQFYKTLFCSRVFCFRKPYKQKILKFIKLACFTLSQFRQGTEFH